MIEKEYALIVAGGKGTRFSSSVPKQFIELHGKPVLLHTLEAFYRYSPEIRIVLVVPESDRETWKHICKKYHFEKPLLVQSGGATRFQSVKRGLELVEEGLVAIHDGVRPLVSLKIIENSFRVARSLQSAVAAVAVKDSVRMTDEIMSKADTAPSGHTRSVDRSLVHLIQTPQTFEAALIKKAYALPEDPSLTDDASVFERAGFPVFLIEGSYQNIKITTPEDLLIAQAFLSRASSL